MAGDKREKNTPSLSAEPKKIHPTSPYYYLHPSRARRASGTTNRTRGRTWETVPIHGPCRFSTFTVIDNTMSWIHAESPACLMGSSRVRDGRSPLTSVHGSVCTQKSVSGNETNRCVGDENTGSAGHGATLSIGQAHRHRGAGYRSCQGSGSEVREGLRNVKSQALVWVSVYSMHRRGGDSYEVVRFHVFCPHGSKPHTDDGGEPP